jgi:FkbM family methyltransferase
VIWVEALPNIHQRLAERIADIPDQRALCALLGDQDGVDTDFFISNNWDGASSSMFPFGTYGDGAMSLWPELGLAMTKRLHLKTMRLDTLLRKNGVDAADYDFWVADLQGAELLALNGAGDILQVCHTLTVEVSTVPVYAGGVLWEEIALWLAEHGFTALWTPELPHDDVAFARTA